MAKFTIEVELDWLHDEDIDEMLKREVVEGIQDRLTRNIEREIKEQVIEKVEEESNRVVDHFLESVVSDRIEDIKIPHKESSFSTEVEMIPISEYIGKRFEEMATEKRYNRKGERHNRYDDRKAYSLIEYLTNDFIAEELNDKAIELIQQAKTRAEQTLIDSLEDNLQAQLNKDMLERLNVPELLEAMKNTILIEEENK